MLESESRNQMQGVHRQHTDDHPEHYTQLTKVHGVHPIDPGSGAVQGDTLRDFIYRSLHTSDGTQAFRNWLWRVAQRRGYVI